RPEALEAALTSRPGRIDQAIEFPMPDDEGRAKLVKLYSQNVKVSDDVVELIVKRTSGVSASFIRELMRRAAEFFLERGGARKIDPADIENALEELLMSGGTLNRKLLGAARSDYGFRRKPSYPQLLFPLVKGSSLVTRFPGVPASIPRKPAIEAGLGRAGHEA